MKKGEIEMKQEYRNYLAGIIIATLLAAALLGFHIISCKTLKAERVMEAETISPPTPTLVPKDEPFTSLADGSIVFESDMPTLYPVRLDTNINKRMEDLRDAIERMNTKINEVLLEELHNPDKDTGFTAAPISSKWKFTADEHTRIKPSISASEDFNNGFTLEANNLTFIAGGRELIRIYDTGLITGEGGRTIGQLNEREKILMLKLISR